LQMVKSGSSYLSQSELPLTFGLGKPQAGKVVSIEVLWPSGKKESISGIRANQSITLLEGKGMVGATTIVFSSGSHDPRE
jgi:hypothetical protein